MPRDLRNHRADFATTRWSIVLAAGRADSPSARDALAALCKSYWYPLYAFARRRGYRGDQAEDLTQGFFARFLEKHNVQDADRARGKFRNFLLASFKNFLANEHDRNTAKKRGGEFAFESIDSANAEHRYASLPHSLSPEQELEQQWALSMLETVVKQLEAEYTCAGKAPLFSLLKEFLPGSASELTYRQCADSLSVSEAAVKMAVLRLRRRYRQVLREQIADTLPPDGSIDEEIRYLLSIIGA